MKTLKRKTKKKKNTLNSIHDILHTAEDQCKTKQEILSRIKCKQKRKIFKEMSIASVSCEKTSSNLTYM